MGKLCDLKTGKSDIGTRFWWSFFHLVHTQDIIHSVLCASVCLCVYVQLPMSKERVCRMAGNFILPQGKRSSLYQRDGLMGWVTSLGQFKWKTIPEITTLNQGPRDFDIWICPSWGNKQHLKKCVYVALCIRFRKAPYSLAFQTLIGPVFFPWSWLLACNFFDQWNMVEMML